MIYQVRLGPDPNVLGRFSYSTTLPSHYVRRLIQEVLVSITDEKLELPQVSLHPLGGSLTVADPERFQNALVCLHNVLLV